MKTNYVDISNGAKSTAYLDQERGVQAKHTTQNKAFYFELIRKVTDKYYI